MLYDNPYCMRVAAQLLKQFGHDPQELARQISGELSRLYRLGQTSMEVPVRKALDSSYRRSPA